MYHFYNHPKHEPRGRLVLTSRLRFKLNLYNITKSYSMSVHIRMVHGLVPVYERIYRHPRTCRIPLSLALQDEEGRHEHMSSISGNIYG